MGISDDKTLDSRVKPSDGAALDKGQCFDRYQYLEFLGEGGMARVYKAFDPTLGRYVALKFIRGDDPEAGQRLLMEARAQAKIDHENVCKVFEVGEDPSNGRPFISMQFINGKPLRALFSEMSVEQKIRLMKEIADGIHAAHRVGLIHRDIKPANIMVERAEDGTWIPYVTDFGLAREALAPGLTATGVIVGSPWYMSPEQARGVVHKLDRRSDIYSLGVSYYELLTGKLPTEGESGVDVLLNILESEPVPLRRIDPDLPEDLETIIMKCLEKEPAMRYDSARILAEDLQRYLEGEPVTARRTGLWYRASKKARKHRVAFIALAVAAVLVFASVVAGIWIWWTGRQQMMLANQYGQQVREMESMMRYSYMMPLHDVTPEREKVRHVMDEIEAQISKARAAYGPGHYALGRGALLLNDYPNAYDHLQKAWQRGYRAPQVAYALGATLGELYKQEKEKAEAAGKMSETRHSDLKKKYLQPAVSFLKSSEGVHLDAPEYVEALIAFYERRYTDAVKKAEIAIDKIPWLYEARNLQGNVYSAIAADLGEQGKTKEALETLAQAEASYQEALKTGNSDERGYLGICNAETTVMRIQLYQSQGQPSVDLGKALDSCANATMANPENGEAYRLMGLAYARKGEYNSDQGQDPYQALVQSEYYLKQALKINARDSGALENLGFNYYQRSYYETSQGRSPSDLLKQTIGYYQRAIEVDPNNPEAWSGLGFALKDLADANSLEDPLALYSKSISSLQKAIEIDPENSLLYYNIGSSYESLGTYQFAHGTAPLQSLEAAERAFETSRKINPGLSGMREAISDVRVVRAQYELVTGQDPTGSATKAIQILEPVLNQNKDTQAHLDYAAGSLVLAEYELARGNALDAFLKDVSDNLTAAEAIDADDVSVLLNSGKMELLMARWNMSHHNPPEDAFGKARQDLKQAIDLNESAESWKVMAEAHRWRAEWLLSRKQSVQSAIDSGLAAADQSLKLNPKYAEALAVKGVLFLLQARSATDPSRRAESAQKSREFLKQALLLNKNLDHMYHPYLTQSEQL